MAEFGKANILQALSSLTKAGKIHRVCRGVYDYPRCSELLNRQLSPDIDQVAHALARKSNWRNHTERNHQVAGNRLLKPPSMVSLTDAVVRCRKRLGGILNYYY